MFRVGQRVVCVDDDFCVANHGRRIPANPPMERAVYTIRSILRRRGRDFVLLAEIKNEIRHFVEYGETLEPAFSATRFRPIVSRPTSIAVFEEILRKASAPVGLGVG